MASVKSNASGWHGIWMYTGLPRACAVAQASNISTQRSGARSLYMAAPVALKMARRWRAATSSSSSTRFAPEASCTIPAARVPIAPTSASNSDSSVMVEGIGTPP